MITGKQKTLSCSPQDNNSSEHGMTNTRYEYSFKERLFDVKDKFIVDFGTGYGWGIQTLFRYGNPKQVIGIDLNEKAWKEAKRFEGDKVKIIRDEIWQTGLEKESVDIGMVIETIEHVDSEELNLFLDEVHKILKIKGILYIMTPEQRLDKSEYPAGSHWTEYGLNELIKIIEMKGFKNIYKRHGSGDLFGSMVFMFEKLEVY